MYQCSSRIKELESQFEMLHYANKVVVVEKEENKVEKEEKIHKAALSNDAIMKNNQLSRCESAVVCEDKTTQKNSKN